MDALSDARRDARDIFLRALDATRVSRAMERRVTCNADALAMDGHSYALSGYRNLLLVSIGKAAGTMAACVSAYRRR